VSTFNWIELAIGSPRQRGLFIPLEDVSYYILDEGEDKAVYRSMYIYDEEGKDFVNKTGSVKDYFGPRHIDEVIVDIDKGQNTDAYTLKCAQAFIYELEQFEVPYNAIQPYFSGTGYHIHLTNEVFNFQSSDDLPFIVKETMKKLFGKKIDLSVYQRTAIYRLPHTLNQKSALYKTPFTVQEINQLQANQIRDKSRKRRLDFVFSELYAEGELESTIITEIPKIKEIKAVVEPRKVVPCVQEMYEQGPIQGSRNNTMLRIASHFRRHGIPSSATKAALLEWNNGQLNENIILEKVESTYNAGYKYSCKDHIMAEHCKTYCVFYDRKDYLIDLYTSDDLQKVLKERLETDFSGRVIDLGKVLGVEQECLIYPGELVTIFGATGSNKTTFAHNLVLGYDATEDRIRKEWQIPTLFLSLELSGWYMHRRALQIVSGKDKDFVTKNYDMLYEHYKEELSHIIYQTVSPTILQIKDAIRDHQPHAVVVDYIDLIEPPKHIRGEYETVRFVSHSLSNLAVNQDIIIIQISQISREYSRNQIMDLYAGKGSGAIENASRKVIGITGKAEEKTKSLTLYKNSDGELFSDVQLNWTPSFRLRRTDYAPTPDSRVQQRQSS
jgi:hypothetical protein